MKTLDMKPGSILFLILILISSCTQKQATEEASIPVSEDGWTVLLNDDLTGWEANGELNMNFDNGVLTLSIHADNPNSVLVSQAVYDNFQLEFEFKSQEPETGVLFRFNDQLRIAPRKAGYLISTDFNPDHQNPAGTIISTARATVLEDIEVGEWNKMTVQAQGSHLKVYINDQLVAEANDKRFSQGKLGILPPLTADKTVSFKNMRIKPLVMATVVTELLEDRYRSDQMNSWDTLFDGVTLGGWTPIGDGSWEVVDGAIHGFSGDEGGFLVSDNAYKDFYLKTIFKIIKEDNSGIFIRKSPDSAAVTITDAIECNIYDHNGPSHAYSTGSIATHARAWYGMIDYNDWNEMEIFAEDEHIVMFVNGQKSSESYLPESFDKAGNICLQGGIKVFAPDKGPSDVYFREVMVKSFD